MKTAAFVLLAEFLSSAGAALCTTRTSTARCSIISVVLQWRKATTTTLARRARTAAADLPRSPRRRRAMLHTPPSATNTSSGPPYNTRARVDPLPNRATATSNASVQDAGQVPDSQNLILSCSTPTPSAAVTNFRGPFAEVRADPTYTHCSLSARARDIHQVRSGVVLSQA